jgi:uncharacterized protein
LLDRLTSAFIAHALEPVLRKAGHPASFQNFLRALAARSGQILNLTDVARDLGVAVTTAKAWLRVLEATFQVIVMRPCHVNIGRRLVKTPMVYFTDTGTLCDLAGLKDPERAVAGPMGAAIFKTAVLTEIVKTIADCGAETCRYFWRTSAGLEVDLLPDTGGTLVPIEVKLSSTPSPPMALGIRTLREDLGSEVGPGYVVQGGRCAPGPSGLR